MKVAVIGGGIAGLAAAYRLSRAGVSVTVFERDDALGGLASSFDHGGVKIERYYHFICRPDRPYLELIDELDLTSQLRWRRTRMGYFHEGRYFPFGTPLSLLRFSPLSLVSRIRFGLSTLEAKRTSSWRDLDEVTAKEWLIAKQGRQAFDIVWKPLLELKFGDRADEISAAWIWARINRVANSREGILMREHLGHLEGGTQTLVDEITRRIEEAGGRIHAGTTVDEIVVEDGAVRGVVVDGERIESDAVASTVASPVFLRLTPGLPKDFSDLLSGIEYYGVACWLLVTDEPLTPDFWLNVHDARVSFPGVIQYTNLNPMPGLDGRHVLYIPYYMATNDPRFTMRAEEWRSRLFEEIEVIRPGFRRHVETAFLFRDEHAQPVFSSGFHARFAAAEDPPTPVRGLYRIDMSQIYPDDRSLVNAIDKGNALARCILEGGAGDRPS